VQNLPVPRPFRARPRHLPKREELITWEAGTRSSAGRFTWERKYDVAAIKAETAQRVKKSSTTRWRSRRPAPSGGPEAMDDLYATPITED
jgi:hypothetical protein